MMRLARRLTHLLTVALAILAAAAVRADDAYAMELYMTYVGPGNGQAMNLRSGQPTAWYDNQWGGILRNDITDVGPGITTYIDIPGDGVVRTFCIDISDHAQQGYFGLENPSGAPRPNVTGGIGPMGATRSRWLEVLALNYWDDNVSTGYLEGGNDDLWDVGDTTAVSTSKNTRYAALQAAIWEIVFDGAAASNIPVSWSLGDGSNFTDFGLSDRNLDGHLNASSQAVRIEGNRILGEIQALVGSSINSFDTMFSEYQPLGALTSPSPYHQHGTGNDQDMLVRTLTDVPEPSGMMLAGLGLVGLLSRRRKRAA